MNVKIIYSNEKDRELFNLNDLKFPIFVEYINMNTIKGKKEGWKILNYYGTSKTPFVELDSSIPFYSENGNAIYQLINYINTLMDINIKFKKLNENAITPHYKHEGDACCDLYATSCKYNPKYDRFEYGLGFATEFSTDYEAELKPRSTNCKKDCYLPNSIGTIEGNYRGEWMCMYKLRTPFEQLFPTGDRELNLLEMENEYAPYKVGEAVCQVAFRKKLNQIWKEVDELEDSNRGADGGLIREGK